jgi:hypothetical protein
VAQRDKNPVTFHHEASFKQDICLSRRERDCGKREGLDGSKKEVRLMASTAPDALSVGKQVSTVITNM